jgi:predicted permease
MQVPNQGVSIASAFLIASTEDCRQAMRYLLRHWQSTTLCLALIATSVAVASCSFSLYSAVVLRTLPVSDPERLVRIVRISPAGAARSQFSYRVFEALRHNVQSVENVSAAFQTNATIRDQLRIDRVRLESASPGFFKILELDTLVGRSPKDPQEILLSHHFWQSHYQNDLNVIGKPVIVLNQPMVIVGVASKQFHGASVETCADVWTALSALEQFFPDANVQENAGLELFARLPPGVHLQAAAQEIRNLLSADMRGKHSPNDPDTFDLEPIPHGVSLWGKRYDRSLQFVIMASVFLCLMASASVGGIRLADVANRSRQFSLRLALGASPLRIFLLPFIESSMLAAVGALLGALGTFIMNKYVGSILPPMRLADNTAVVSTLDVTIDWRVLAFLSGVTAIIVLLAAIPPAWHAAMSDPARRLHRTRPPGTARGLSLLLLGQVAICTCLVIAAAQLAMTVYNLRTVNPGFSPDRIVSFRVDPLLSRADPAALDRALQWWKEQVRLLPRVQGAAFATRGLLRETGIRTTVARAGQRASRSDFLNTSIHVVSPEYFATIGLRIVSGRGLNDTDASAVPKRVVINESFSRRFFDGENPLGKTFGMGVEIEAKSDFEVVGVAADASYRSLREPKQPTFYQPLAKVDQSVMLYVNHLSSLDALTAQVRSLLASRIPDLPISETATLRQDFQRSMTIETLTAQVVQAFAAIGISITVAGIFGLVSLVAASRSKDIAIRTALGAPQSNIVGVVVGQTALCTFGGIAVGFAVAFMGGRALESLLYGVTAQDPLLFLGAGVSIVLAGFAACLWPLVRALREDPASTLRLE